MCELCSRVGLCPEVVFNTCLTVIMQPISRLFGTNEIKLRHKTKTASLMYSKQPLLGVVRGQYFVQVIHYNYAEYRKMQ